MTTFAEFEALAGQEFNNTFRPSWGQIVFDTLAQVRPDLAEQLQGTTRDPSHRVVVPTSFWRWLEDRWDQADRGGMSDRCLTANCPGLRERPEPVCPACEANLDQRWLDTLDDLSPGEAV